MHGDVGSTAGHVAGTVISDHRPTKYRDLASLGGGLDGRGKWRRWVMVNSGVAAKLVLFSVVIAMLTLRLTARDKNPRRGLNRTLLLVSNVLYLLAVRFLCAPAVAGCSGAVHRGLRCRHARSTTMQRRDLGCETRRSLCTGFLRQGFHHIFDNVLVAASKDVVLFVRSAGHPGADTFIHALLMRGLARSRFDVHVACSAGMPGARTPAFEALSTIPDLRLRPSNFGPSLSGRSKLDQAVQLLRGVPTLASFAGLARYIRHNRISVLHSTDRPRDAVSCVLLAKLTGAKSVVHVHVKFADWMGRSVRWAMDRADALVGVSKFVARSLVEQLLLSEDTRGVEMRSMRRHGTFVEPGPVRRARESRRCAVCRVRGPVVSRQGQDLMIRAIPLIRRGSPTSGCSWLARTIVRHVQTGFTAELKELARDLGVLDRVVFTGYRADMPAVMAACDVFALPSLEEPFGLVYLEALAMKKPVVALNNGGTPEVVEHSASGLLSAPGDQTALAANVMALLRDPALRASMGEYGRRQVEARFTTERMARDTEQVYAELAASTRRSRGEILWPCLVPMTQRPVCTLASRPTRGSAPPHPRSTACAP